MSEEVRVQYTLGEEEITRVYLNHCISRGWKPATKKRPTHQSSHKVLYNELEEEAKEKDETVKRNVQNNIADRWRCTVEQKNEDEDEDEDELVHVLTASPLAHSPAAHHQCQVEDAAEHCNMYTTTSPTIIASVALMCHQKMLSAS